MLLQFPANDSEVNLDKVYDPVVVGSATALVYYTSSVGIHDETEYKGNVLQENYAGYDAR